MAEAFADLWELKQLAGLVGAYGVRVINRECLRILKGLLQGIETHLLSFKTDLTKLLAARGNDEEFNNALRALKSRSAEFEAFILKAVSLGNVLAFRRLLHQALRLTNQEMIPHIVESVEVAAHQHPPNFWGDTNRQPTDVIAFDLGIDHRSADQELRALLQPFFQKESGGKSWELYHVLLAVSFEVAPQWKEAVFNSWVDAYENGLTSLIWSAYDVTVAIASLSATSLNDLATIQNRLAEFVELSSDIILRMANKVASEKTTIKDFASIVVFLDMFVQDTKAVSRRELEQHMPIPLLASMWQILDSRQQHKQSKVDR